MLCTANYTIIISLCLRYASSPGVVYAGNECNRKSFVRHPVMLHCSCCSRAREKP